MTSRKVISKDYPQFPKEVPRIDPSNFKLDYTERIPSGSALSEPQAAQVDMIRQPDDFGTVLREVELLEPVGSRQQTNY
eukprot:2043198-Rhodomonas_salina.2